MSLEVTYDGTPLGYDFKPTRVDVTTRADGEAAFGGVQFEDPDATSDFVGHRLVTIEEDACSQPRIFTGFTVERGIGRSREDALIGDVTQRLVNMSLVDMNTALGFRMITGADGNRPAETWAARLTWILGSDYLSEFISSDETWIVTNTVSCEASDYRSAYPTAVLDDLVDRSGGAYIYHAFWDTTADEVRLFFDNDVETIGACSLSISNLDADEDGVTVFFPDQVSKLAREPDQTYSDVTVVYDRGAKKLHRYRPSTATTYVRRGTSIDRPYTRSASTATSQAEKWLDKHSVETDRITCTIQVPAASVGLIQAGQSIQARFSHLGLPYSQAGGATMRIVSYSPKPTSDVGDWYDVALELVYRPAVAPPAEFHQAVLCSARIGHTNITANGTYDIVFAGALATSHPKVIEGTMPAVLQDTDGYTGTPGDWQTGTLYELTVPAGLDGTYLVGLEEIAGVPMSEWWIPASPPLPNPQQVPYPYGGVHGHSGTGVAGGGTQTVVWKLLKNGATVLDSQTWTRTGSGYLYVTPSGTRGLLATVDLVEDDTISATITVSGNPWPFWNLANFFGPDYTSPVGVMFMTMTAGADVVTPIPTTPSPRVTISDVPPTADDDFDDGHSVGDLWVNTTTGTQYVIVDTTPGAAVWLATTNPRVTEDAGNPTADDDATLGYLVGDLWVNTTSGEVFILTDSTPTAAVWVSISAAPTGHIVAVFDAGTEAITGQPEVDVILPAAGTITSWTLLADASGSAVIDVWSDTYANFPPTDDDSITASAPPTLTTAVKATDATLTGWDKTLVAGDILRFHLDSSSTVKRLVLTLAYTRS